MKIKMKTSDMKAYIKQKDPHFATDEFLASLSYEELCEYYQSCKDAENPEPDDWCARLERVRVNNM